ncbi:polysaccharide pyruvyl transferase family protein [Spirosoma fluviale]|uniref:Polysaccharide pyruvyl transferase n=1 Tax=Spirosoma fluviale TaxID=1597977 RepID=A0A286GRX8_9BACT|nr:polysaccharide pyruvyl transferase family protein [Spirosoma fluviale]SOD98325.1 Polysaccharide pyruvyl transferase [Spirosoma fluviale]
MSTKRETFEEKEIRVGIVTFHTPINYGAVLQVYALQTYLKIQFPDYNVKVIDFYTDKHDKKYSVFPLFRKNILIYLFQLICTLIRYSKLKNRKNKFKSFVATHLSLTKRYKTQEEFLKNVPDMDIYITGSDQVFHPKAEYKKVYFLGFEKWNGLKIAYAPSFGMSNFTEEIANELKPYLLDFDSLSCREEDGAAFISTVTGRTVQSVLDPTFLLSKNQWSEMAIGPDEKRKYIFIYDLNGAENLVEIAKKIKEKTGYIIICQTQKAHKFYDVDIQLFDTGPEEFAGYINDAEYVVTDSFHGVAFSVFLHKRFYTYIAMPKASTRVRSMLRKLDLQDRIIENEKAHEFEFSGPEIKDYKSTLNAQILASKSYLTESLTFLQKI